MELCEATLKTTVGQDVKASVFLLLDSLVRDTAKAKSLLTIVLGKSLFPGGDLGVISDLIPLFFVLLALITLLQTVFILNIVVDRVVHQAVTTQAAHGFSNVGKNILTSELRRGAS